MKLGRRDLGWGQRRGRGKRGKANWKDPQGVSDVWQTQGLETRHFGSVAIVGLSGEFSDVWQGKGVRGRETGNSGKARKRIGRAASLELGKHGKE